MKKLSRAQMGVIIALSFVLICIMAGLLIWYYPSIGAGADKDPDDGIPAGGDIPTPYKRVRTAEISLNPYLSWELKLEGSGRDEAVFTYIDEETGTVYIFGNTTSTDKDFNARGIFLVAVDVYGVTRENGFFAYGGEYDILRSVTLADGGFLLGVEGVVQPYLLLVGFNGATIKRVDGFLSAFESVNLLRLYADGYLLFTQPENVSLGIKKLRCAFFDRELNYKGSCLADSQYSLQPVETVVISGKPVVFCNAVSSLNTLIAAVEFFVGATARITLLHDYPGAAAGFSVNKGDFLLLTSYNGSSFIRINSQFAVTEVKTLSQLKPLFFTDLDDEFYAAFLDGSGAVLNNNLTAVSTLTHFAPSSVKYINNAALFAGLIRGTDSAESPDTVVVNIYDGGKLIYGAALGLGSSPILAAGKRNIFCVFNKDNGIMINSLRYPLFL